MPLSLPTQVFTLVLCFLLFEPLDTIVTREEGGGGGVGFVSCRVVDNVISTSVVPERLQRRCRHISHYIFFFSILRVK